MLGKLEQQRDTLRHDIGKLQAKLDSLKRDIGPYKTINDLQIQVTSLEVDIKRLNSKRKTVKGSIEHYEAVLAKTDEMVNKLGWTSDDVDNLTEERDKYKGFYTEIVSSVEAVEELDGDYPTGPC